jgi:shikimate kinase
VIISGHSGVGKSTVGEILKAFDLDKIGARIVFNNDERWEYVNTENVSYASGRKAWVVAPGAVLNLAKVGYTIFVGGMSNYQQFFEQGDRLSVYWIFLEAKPDTIWERTQRRGRPRELTEARKQVIWNHDPERRHINYAGQEYSIVWTDDKSPTEVAREVAIMVANRYPFIFQSHLEAVGRYGDGEWPRHKF